MFKNSIETNHNIFDGRLKSQPFVSFDKTILYKMQLLLRQRLEHNIRYAHTFYV